MNCLYWLRNDLRLHDNQVLHWLESHASKVCFLYLIPDDYLDWGSERRTFLKQSLDDLAHQLKLHGHQLGIFQSEPIKKIPEIMQQFDLTHLLMTGEYTTNEIAIEQELATYCETHGFKQHLFDQQTLIPESELPFHLQDLPLLFTHFKNKVEPIIRPARPLGKAQLHYASVPIENEAIHWEPLRSHPDFQGGESAALKHLDNYIWQTQSLGHYNQTRNGLLNFNDSSKISPWLANGSLSIRMVYQELKKFEDKVLKNDSTYWFFYELIWRDYFKFYAKKFGANIFFKKGLGLKEKHFEDNHELFNQWKEAKTPEPFINAHMMELLQTGWMSNRGRQNVACFLAKTLKVNWTWGASWFEKQLIDYDPAQNWGNWNYFAGVGSDARDRHFHPTYQAERYDPQGLYQAKWPSPSKKE